jgi:hypothetical protein
VAQAGRAAAVALARRTGPSAGLALALWLVATPALAREVPAEAPPGPRIPGAQEIADAVLRGLSGVLTSTLDTWWDQSGPVVLGRLVAAAFGAVVAWVWAAVGPVLAAVGALGLALHASLLGSLSGEKKGNEANLTFRDAGDMAQAPERRMSWALPNTVGRGVVSLLSAPPGLGKGWWMWGLLRAMQDGGELFGLSVSRPHTAPGPLARRLGATSKPLRVLWLTEEGPSFGETARRFGIAPGLVTVLQRSDVAATEWPEIVRLVRREAWRRGCAYVIVDPVRAWCPQAEHSNGQAADVFNLARKELAGPGLGAGRPLRPPRHEGRGRVRRRRGRPQQPRRVDGRTDRVEAGQGRPQRPPDARLAPLR